MSLFSCLKLNFNNFIFLVKQYNLQKAKYRYHLIDVKWNKDDETIKLAAVIRGVKNHVIYFEPEKILYDDDLLSEFSPCDVRAITYLSFRKYLKHVNNSLKISAQMIKQGETVFELINPITHRIIRISAKKLRQNHDYLSCLSQIDMINVVSTAVQEQTIKDFKMMEGM